MTSTIADFLAKNIAAHRPNPAKMDGPSIKRNAPNVVLSDDDDADNDDEAKNNPDRLQVLIEPDAQKLVMNTFKQYVSEDDFSELVMFIKDFDSLLFRYRKGKPITREEIDEIENEMEMAENEKSANEDVPDEEGELPPENDNIDEENELGADDNRVDLNPHEEEPSIVVSKRVKASTEFKVCNECTGGTASWCKSNGKCADKENGGPPALAQATNRRRMFANSLATAINSKR